MRSLRLRVAAQPHCHFSNWKDRRGHVSPKIKILIFSMGLTQTMFFTQRTNIDTRIQMYVGWGVTLGRLSPVSMTGDLLTLAMASSCTGRGMQLHARLGMGVGFLVHRVLPWTFNIASSCCLAIFSPANRHDEITGSCRVARQPNSPGKRQNGCQPHRSDRGALLRVVGKTKLWHRGEGSIKGHQIFIRHTAPSPRLCPRSNKLPRKLCR